MDVIEFGYKLPFFQIPPPFFAVNNSSALSESAFVDSAINDLIVQGCVTEVFEAPVIINPLSVSVQKSGKKRLILDLRHVNLFLFKSRFRCEDLCVAKEILNPGDFLFSFDLKSGYHHVDIFPDHRKYLSFAWTFPSDCTRFFQFSVLPFGLSSAPYLFTKLLKPLVTKWRSEANSNKAKITSLQVHDDLLKSGFLPNEDKCVWEPTQVITWLGTVLNMSSSVISATDKRISSLQEDLAFLLATSLSSHPVRKLASVCGKIISLGNCVGNFSRLMSRNIFAVINSAPSWNSYVVLSPEALAELNFWKDNVSSLNGFPFGRLSRSLPKLFTQMPPLQNLEMIHIQGLLPVGGWTNCKANSSIFYCDNSRMQGRGVNYGQEMDPLESIKRTIDSGNRIGGLENMLQIKSTISRPHWKLGCAQDISGKNFPSIERP